MKQDIFNEASNKDINTENINKNNVKIGRYSDYINGSKAFTLTKYHIEFLLTTGLAMDGIDVECKIFQNRLEKEIENVLKEGEI